MKLLKPKEIERVFELLAEANPAPATELESVNVYTLLVAVVLSAQMTDRGVNRATGPLFAVASTPEAMLALGEEGLKGYIKSINLYPTKARHVIALSRILVDRFGGEVPGTRDKLESLPGVGRKTANVMLNVAFGQATMPVDTHLMRLAPRAGLSAGTKPREIEDDLLKKVPARFLRDAHHLLLLHGRYVCTARNPKCAECPIESLCPKNGL
ncbi:MAG TPA: endonuclease III [Treponemataceae bacterium]|nr:endonuclease III [Treponemataceae bacterium]HPS44953.1 endonuclease III [Treponemataceae bacterium]